MAEFSNHTDQELVALLKESNDGVLEEIYNRYWKRLYNAAYKRLSNTNHCEEFVQDVFTTLWARRTEITIDSGLANYLYTSIKNSIIDFHRREVLKEQYILSKRVIEIDTSTEDDIHVRDLKTKIDLMVRMLPQKCRSVFMLSRTEHKTNLEIAALLNISEKTVEGHLTKALKYLRTSLNQFMIVSFVIIINYLF